MTQPARRLGSGKTGVASKVPPFPVVGIGASAGGLEALELFLRHVPERCGMAFVVVQHLDPTRKGLLVELLQRATTMNVVQVKDRTPIRPDRVYVIPPNKDMSVLHGVLHLLDPVAPRGLRLPVDLFFRSLAEDMEERSIGVILSGMGTDGTLGLKAIKGKAGIVFVQDPTSAKFDGMPRSAIDGGLADVIDRPEALPGRIVDHLRRVPLIAGRGAAGTHDRHSALDKIVMLLRGHTGHDFSQYKKGTLYRRIERRMAIHRIDRIAGYVRFLRENPSELDLLFKELLIGVTSFFRDPAVWDELKAKVIPALLKEHPPDEALRIWVPACATGEEAYSLAMIFREVAEERGTAGRPALQIFATDLDAETIDKARSGIFPANIAADVSPERLTRFFVQVERGYQIGRSIREAVTFAQHNLIMSPPFTRLDLVSCRNLLIYLAPELQNQVLALLHYSLKAGGLLHLGTAETVGECTDLFAPIGDRARMYRRLESVRRVSAVDFPSSLSLVWTDVPPPVATSPGSLQSQAEHLILLRYAPATVLINVGGDILFISGRTGKYLEPPAGKANWNVFAMAREGLQHGLRTAVRKAIQESDTAVRTSVRIRTDSGWQAVDLTVHSLAGPDALRGLVMLVFRDVDQEPEATAPAEATGPRAGRGRLASMGRDLELARLELQTTREEMQSSQEELHLANEELQSANEELQSANEELTTSKEEMQSMNEELQTLNHELQTKVDDLARLSNDLKNLLDRTELAIVFLDRTLRVRQYTVGSNAIFRLIAGDVGRPITDIASEVVYPDLAADAQEVLRTLDARERTAATRDGRWFTVRIVPYRTTENVVDGVVVTFTDATARMLLEDRVRRAEA